MMGLMMDYPLTLSHILERSARLYPRKEIASRLPGGQMYRYTYLGFHARVHRLAHALHALGFREGARIGTLCWNTYRHLELYFAAPCAGYVLHTLNLRLSAEDLTYIINHGGDSAICVDASLLPVLRPVLKDLPAVRQVIVLDDSPDEQRPEGALDYEELLAAAPDQPYAWPRFDENTAAAMCYTSGTTGHPKGVLYSHRAIFLHSYGGCMADSIALSERDTILQLVPMFHVNGWGMPFSGVMTGSRLIFPGRQLQPADLAALIEHERVTVTGGVPTLWMTLYEHLESHPADISSLRRVGVGGSALPRQFVESYYKKYGLELMLAWGMTETTPLATVNIPKKHLDSLPEGQRIDLLTRHGMPLPGVDIRIVDEQGRELPWDGTTVGELQVRGPWVTSGYYNDPRSKDAFMDGWFRTGDVATIDGEGYIQITDRTKDLVKSGGEWISSVDLENAIMAHPKVAEAAVVGVFHPKWQERPLACVVPQPEHRGRISKQELLEFLAPRVAKWWLPDDVVFIEAVPKTSVGKFNKRVLRERFRSYLAAETATSQEH